jgi:hypothetical protein
MQSATVDYVLTATVMVGLFLSVANLVVSVLNGRSTQLAQIKATSDMRVLYERAYRRAPLISRRLASIARPGKTERRRVPPKAQD